MVHSMALYKNMEVQPSEIRRIEHLLKDQKGQQRFRQLLPVFWGLIAFKCVLGEWTLIHFQVPISSFWVWFPSFCTALVATLVYGKYSAKGIRREPPTIRIDFAVWILSIISMVVIAYFGYQSRSLEIPDLATLFSVVFAITYTIHGKLENVPMFYKVAGGWIITAIVLIINDNLSNLLIFAGAIFLLVVCPFTWIYWKQK